MNKNLTPFLNKLRETVAEWVPELENWMAVWTSHLNTWRDESTPRLEIKVKTVYLFGSYAKGTATAQSDVDIAIEFTPNRPWDVSESTQLFMEISDKWEDCLSERVGVPVQMELADETNDEIEKYLSAAHIILYSSKIAF